MITPLIEGDDIPYSAVVGDFVDIHEGDRWECIMCGNCCGNIFSKTWLDVSLRKHIGDPIDGYCNHHDQGNHECHIHSSRPNICRGYPFIIRKSGDHYKVQVHKRCNGIGVGPVVDLGSKALELVKYCEEEYDIEFIVKSDDDGVIRMYRIK